MVILAILAIGMVFAFMILTIEIIKGHHKGMERKQVILVFAVFTLLGWGTLLIKIWHMYHFRSNYKW